MLPKHPARHPASYLAVFQISYRSSPQVATNNSAMETEISSVNVT